VGALICFESAHPRLAREYRAAGVDALVVLTNDGWLVGSVAPYQHAAHAALRAIETRVGVVRAANNGISLYADPLGRVRETTPLLARAAPVFAVETTDARTPYVRLGDWVGSLSLLASVALAIRHRGARPRREARA
jgi:apolipoprotein N-acyltransferase